MNKFQKKTHKEIKRFMEYHNIDDSKYPRIKFVYKITNFAPCMYCNSCLNSNNDCILNIDETDIHEFLCWKL